MYTLTDEFVYIPKPTKKVLTHIELAMAEQSLEAAKNDGLVSETELKKMHSQFLSDKRYHEEEKQNLLDKIKSFGYGAGMILMMQGITSANHEVNTRSLFVEGEVTFGLTQALMSASFSKGHQEAEFDYQKPGFGAETAGGLNSRERYKPTSLEKRMKIYDGD